MLNSEKSFTLLELLIVIGILAVLATSAVVVLNPAELLKQSRDTKRIADLKALNSALNLYSLGNGSYGSANTVYISLPYATADCDYGSGNPLLLPSLPSGWNYSCKSDTDYRKIDSTGWVPVDLTLIESGAPFSALPIDPINNSLSGLYYNYVASPADYVFASLLESKKYLKQIALTDGGSDDARYEIGRNLTLWTNALAIAGYWKLDESSGTTAVDFTMNGNNGTLTNGPTWTIGKVNNGLSFNGVNNYVIVPDVPELSGGRDLTVLTWFKLNAGGGDPGNPIPFVFKFYGVDNKDWGLGMINDLIYFGYELAGNNWDNPPTNGLMGTNVISAGDWHYGAFTYNNSTREVKIYLNGEPENSTILPSTSPDTPTNVEFGRSGYKNRFFNGFLDEIRIYNRVLFDWEIQALFNSAN
ncbi:MAG: LamG-like jellyroll fold domain-containing protein [Patescibacteria group bacterium]